MSEARFYIDGRCVARAVMPFVPGVSAKATCRECGHDHVTPSDRYPRAVTVALGVESVCVTQPDDTHVRREPGRRYGVLSIRVPFWLGLRLWRWCR